MMKNIFAVLHMRHFAMGVHSVINRQFFYIYIKQFWLKLLYTLWCKNVTLFIFAVTLSNRIICW